MSLQSKIDAMIKQGVFPARFATIISDFYASYVKAGQKNGYRSEELDPIFSQYLDTIHEQLTHPYTFELYHQRILTPIDYYNLGLNLVRPLITFSTSSIQGQNHLETIAQTVAKGENVILLSNHQIEADPQVINLALEKTHPKLAADMIFVAGHRVITDPLAVPISKGVNLLCIYSKNYIENPPELKHDKLMHNRRTMNQMAELLAQGGKCIYVACSGGRDRPDSSGVVHVADFDPNGIEMFRLMAQKSHKPTHFHTLALSTHNLQPPPNNIKISLGEKREVFASPIHLTFGPAIDMEACAGDTHDKIQRRQNRANFIWNKVAQDYAR